MTPRVLIVAGSDSGGGAGIQADIKTVTMLGGHAMTAITALTAQNTLRVDGVVAVDPDFVAAQIETSVSDIGVDAVKTGMLPNAAVTAKIVEVLARLIAARAGGEPLPIVVDPVMVSSSGHALVDDSTVGTLKTALFPLAKLITPNLPELALLTGRTLDSADAIEGAARMLARQQAVFVLAKGGHGDGDIVTDLLIEPDGRITRFSAARIITSSNHGTGCTLASAIATGLAEGMALIDAVKRALAFVRAALEAAPGLGTGHGPLGHQYVRREFL